MTEVDQPLSLCEVNCCYPYRNITNNFCAVTFSLGILQHDNVSCLSSTTFPITCFEFTFACQQH